MFTIDATTFADEVRGAGPDLDPARANLLFAREIAYPDLRPSEYLLRLDDLRVAAARALAPHADTLARGQALADFLFGADGLQGNRGDYGDPRNSYLNEVLDRRLGLPITLSAVYLHVGRALGLPAQGVGLPGHFIVSVADGAQRLYLDPFNGGRALTTAECARLVSQATGHPGEFDARWLAPTAPPGIVARMLNNLRNAYTRAEAWPQAIRTLERLRELEPEAPGHVRDLGMVYYKEGAYQRAVDCFSEYLAMAPDARDAAAVRQSRSLLLDELARMN